MVRLTGYVEIAGRRELLDWTIADGRIIEGAGLGSHGITVKVDEAPVAPSPTPTPETPVDAPAPAPVEPKSFEDMNKTELQVECNTVRGEFKGVRPTCSFAHEGTPLMEL